MLEAVATVETVFFALPAKEVPKVVVDVVVVSGVVVVLLEKCSMFFEVMLFLELVLLILAEGTPCLPLALLGPDSIVSLLATAAFEEFVVDEDRGCFSFEDGVLKSGVLFKKTKFKLMLIKGVLSLIVKKAKIVQFKTTNNAYLDRTTGAALGA